MAAEDEGGGQRMRVGAEDEGGGQRTEAGGLFGGRSYGGKCGGSDKSGKGARPGPQSGCGGWDAPASSFSHSTLASPSVDNITQCLAFCLEQHFIKYSKICSA